MVECRSRTEIQRCPRHLTITWHFLVNLKSTWTFLDLVDIESQTPKRLRNQSLRRLQGPRRLHAGLLRRPAPSGRPAQPFTTRKSCSNTISMESCEYDKYCLLLRRPAPSGRPAQHDTIGTFTPNYGWKTFYSYTQLLLEDLWSKNHKSCIQGTGQ